MLNKILVIAAHPDDESFGCLGTLINYKADADEIYFLWFTEGRNQRYGAEQCAGKLGTRYRILDFADQTLDQVKFTSLISVIEEELETVKPNIVFMPFIADLNRDHRIVSEAAMVACRPYASNAPKEVWMYHIQGTTELGFRSFKEDKIVKIDRGLKAQLLKEWYPGELINGREKVNDKEVFERWPI